MNSCQTCTIEREKILLPLCETKRLPHSFLFNFALELISNAHHIGSYKMKFFKVTSKCALESDFIFEKAKPNIYEDLYLTNFLLFVIKVGHKRKPYTLIGFLLYFQLQTRKQKI